MIIKLYIARRESKLFQKQVADKIGISEKSYQMKETGQREFTIQEGLMLAKVFNCTLNDLFQEDVPQTEIAIQTSEDINLIKTIHDLTGLYLNKKGD